MATVHDVQGPSAVDILTRALTSYERDELTGLIRVSGRPGGLLTLRHGVVLSARSPGAPDLETLLLRSGRAPRGDAELRVLRLMALHDAVFAIAAGQVDGCAPAPPTARPAKTPRTSEECPSVLMGEAVRKLAALQRLPNPVAPYGDVLLAASDEGESAGSGLNQDIIALADGRRTARDIAFRTGRGLYTITVAASRLLGQGLIVRVPPGGVTAGPGFPDAAEPPLRRRLAGGAPQSAASASGNTSANPGEFGADEITGDGLPRRSPGASGIATTLTAEHSAASWKGIFRRAGRVRPVDQESDAQRK